MLLFTRQQFRRYRIPRPFFIPHHRLNPPAFTVEVQRKNIHAARHHFFRGLHAPLITAQHRRDISEPLDLLPELNFRKSLLHQKIVALIQILLIIRSPRLHLSRFILRKGNVSHARRKPKSGRDPIAAALPHRPKSSRNSLLQFLQSCSRPPEAVQSSAPPHDASRQAFPSLFLRRFRRQAIHKIKPPPPRRRTHHRNFSRTP